MRTSELPPSLGLFLLPDLSLNPFTFPCICPLLSVSGSDSGLVPLPETVLDNDHVPLPLPLILPLNCLSLGFPYPLFLPWTRPCPRPCP